MSRARAAYRRLLAISTDCVSVVARWALSENMIIMNKPGKYSPWLVLSLSPSRSVLLPCSLALSLSPSLSLTLALSFAPSLLLPLFCSLSFAPSLLLPRSLPLSLALSLAPSLSLSVSLSPSRCALLLLRCRVSWECQIRDSRSGGGCGTPRGRCCCQTAHGNRPRHSSVCFFPRLPSKRLAWRSALHRRPLL